MNSRAALELVRLIPLMERTSGRAEVQVGLIDGPVATSHPELSGQNIREIPGSVGGKCSQTSSAACLHGTFVAGILAAKRDSAAPAICPSCTMLIRPIFSEDVVDGEQIPSATPDELAAAIVEMVEAGASVINMSASLAQPSTKEERALGEALNFAAARGVIIVAAAGNQGTIGSTAITRHPWVIPVVACNLRGRPTPESNLSHSSGRRGLSAAGEGITSLGPDGKAHAFGGTSAATPFVTGAIALLLSEFPAVSGAQVKATIARSHATRRGAVVPPLLDAWAAYQAIALESQRR